MQVAGGNIELLEKVWNDMSIYSVYELMILQRQYAEFNKIF